jgi:hypothetical protein
MRNCYVNNSDGAGLAWVDEDGLHVRKGYFNWSELWKDMRGLKDYPAVLHCRLATHGSVRAENCHPFLLNNGVAAAHNGVISVAPLDADMTDSESFAIKYIEPWTVEELRTDKVRGLLEQALGSHNKMALLDASGQITLLNGEGGVEFKDVWFSNDSYAEDYFASYTFMFDRVGKGSRLAGAGKPSAGKAAVDDLDRYAFPCDHRFGLDGICTYTGSVCDGDCVYVRAFEAESGHR